jgi:ADP-heptose:LPS heptosyltransferase
MAPHLTTTPVESVGFSLRAEGHPGNGNITARSIAICRALGVQEGIEGPRLTLNKDASSHVGQQLRSIGITPPRPYVVIHPFAGWQYRMWDISNFNILAREIVERLNYDVLFLCSVEEAGYLLPSRIMFANDDRVRFFPSPDLFASALVIQQASLFIGNDSGPLHLAAALQVKTVGLFGPASPDLTAPPHRSGTFLYKKVDCSPCSQQQCIKPGHSCMMLISPDEVLAAVLNILSPLPYDAMVVNG